VIGVAMPPKPRLAVKPLAIVSVRHRALRHCDQLCADRHIEFCHIDF
jgi:hypothetical protein